MTYKVPFVDYPAHYRSMESEIDTAIKEALSKGDLILRHQVQDFENSMASFLGVKYAVGVNSCTDAMILSLHAAGIGQGDEVITVAHTFVATIESIVHCGATPILVDVGDDFNMDMDKLEQAINPHTRAILPVHLNGRLCDMGKLMAIAEKQNLRVIEDAAQALGAAFDGRKAGSFGLAGCFSFYPAKLLGAAGDGGLVCTNEESFAEKIRLLRDHGRPPQDKNKHLCYGFTSRLVNLQAAILNVKLRYLAKWIQRRREIAGLYGRGLSNIPSVRTPPSPTSTGCFFDVYQNYVLRVSERDRLALYLEEKGIETIISNPIPVHHQQALGLSHFYLPNTEKFAKEIISIPLVPEMSNEQVDYVIQAIRSFYLK
ncbi:DegT/DnrJ/EryC1/StrS family aminotransferase [Chloroflexota bacterium]